MAAPHAFFPRGLRSFSGPPLGYPHKVVPARLQLPPFFEGGEENIREKRGALVKYEQAQ